MASYEFVFPIQTGIFCTFDESFPKHLTVNFFKIDSQKGLLIDEKGNSCNVDLSKFDIDWGSISACLTLGENCVDYIKQFYPGKKVTFETASTVSKYGSLEVEPNDPDYFLFFGLN